MKPEDSLTCSQQLALVPTDSDEHGRHATQFLQDPFQYYSSIQA